jgi:hypothetical protein
MRRFSGSLAVLALALLPLACGQKPSVPPSGTAATAATDQAADNGSLAAQNGVPDTSASSGGGMAGMPGMSGMSGMNMPMMPHSDHKPRHGGIVLMNGDLHFEVVMSRSGEYEVYFSNAMRDPLPASIASDVTITVQQQGQPPEPLTLQIDDAGEYWVGHGRAVTDPNASARIAYVIEGKPYWIDMPYVQPVTEKKSAGDRR